MASLRNGTALHVHRLCFGEMVEDGTHLVATVDEPLTADDQSRHHAYVSLHGSSLSHQLLRRGEACRHAHDLTILLLAAAVGIMIAALGAHHHIRYVQACVGTAGTARRHHEVRMIVVYHLHRPYCRVYLTNAAFLQHHLFGTNVPQYKIFTVLAFNRRLLKKGA